MTLQDLLKNYDIDLKKTKLIRHNISNDEVARNYANGYIDIYQSIQKLKRFRDTEYILSFLGVEGTEGEFLGCYKINGYEALRLEKMPLNFYLKSEALDGCVFWKMEITEILCDWINRLVIDWGKATLSWCQNGTTEKEVLYVLPVVSEIVFVSYDKVMLCFDSLKTIVSNSKQHSVWEKRLSSVAGIYLITDTKTGKHYIGSASSEQGGIWGRWSNYANTKHGGNKHLKELLAADSDYCSNFQFSILEVFPIKRDRHEVLEYEALYKQKLQTIKFGLNGN